MDYTLLLARADLFADIGGPGTARVLSRARSVRVERNDILFAEGDDADELFVVVSGRVAVGRKSADGRESLVALMQEGDVLGEMSLFDGGQRSASARAIESSEVLGVPYQVVREIYDEQPGLLWGVVAMLADRLRATDSALSDAVFLDVTGRTAKRLLELAGDQDEFMLPVTQEELAGLVGASRERVNKAIAAFVRLGWIEQLERRYRIVSRVKLEQRSR